MWGGLAYPAKWAKAVTQTHKVLISAQVWKGNDYLQDLPGFIDGSVDVDETRAVRRTCTVNLQSAGYPTDSIVPVLESDLLHPASGNELRLFRGIDYQDGTQDLVPLGVFRMSKPVVKDDGHSVSITISGNDRSFWLSRLKWQAPYVIAAGTDLATAIKSAVLFLAPNTPINFTATNPAPNGISYTVAAQTYGLNIVQSNQPWLDLVALAATAGFELFFDVQGVCVLRPFITPSTQHQVRAFVEGPTCTLLTLERDLDETTEYNGVIVIGNGTGGAPVQGMATITDTTQPNYWGGPWGEVPYIMETSAFPAPGQGNTAATNQANAAALAQLQLINRALSQVSFEIVTDPSLAEGDGIGIVRDKVYNSTAVQSLILSAFTIPLDYTSTEKIKTRPGLDA